MNLTHAAAILMFLASTAKAAEMGALPALPSARQVLEAIHANDAGRKAAVTASAHATAKRVTPLQDHVRIDVYNYSDGSFNVSEPFNARIDIRGYKPFSNDFNFELSGRVGNDSMSGQARSRFSTDPTYGYILNGFGFNAYLDKFGSGWILNGTAGGKSFRYDIQRSFTDSYSVYDPGLDVRLETHSMSSTVDGWYDKNAVNPMQLALLGTVAGILSQPKLRQDPTRP